MFGQCVRALLTVACLWGVLTLAEYIKELLELPLPAAVLGMILLLMSFFALGRIPEFMLASCRLLLQHMSLLFVPAILSVVLYGPMLLQNIVVIVIALVVSTVLSLWATAWLSQKLEAADKESQ